MVKKNIVLMALMMGMGLLTVSVTEGRAEEAKFELKANAAMKEILAERTGKRTTLRMLSGEDIDGTIVTVGNGLVHVSRLAGKDFYDAVIEIDRISAVIFQARQR